MSKKGQHKIKKSTKPPMVDKGPKTKHSDATVTA